jgi:hypothetical protein
MVGSLSDGVHFVHGENTASRHIVLPHALQIRYNALYSGNFPFEERKMI